MSWGDGTIDSETHRAFLTSADNDAVSVVDTSSGRVMRLVAVGQHPISVVVDRATHHVFVANNWDDTVTMLDARSGIVLRTITVGPNPARLVVDERTARVFVVHGRGDPGNNPASALTPFAGISTTGTTILDARSGAVLGQVAVGGSPLDDVGFVNAMNVAVDARRGRVFVINETPTASLNSSAHGSVSVLDARSGHLLHTVPVGRHPIALAVDETTARLFVVNTNSGCTGVDLWRWIPTSIWRLSSLLSQLPRPRCGLQGTVTVIDTSRL
jgi:YVTN family beta-propeller protein